MPVDPVLIAETKAWLRKAAYDLRVASHSLTASPPLLDDVVFHCQQAAEKALKGFLMWNNIPFRFLELTSVFQEYTTERRKLAVKVRTSSATTL